MGKVSSLRQKYIYFAKVMLNNKPYSNDKISFTHKQIMSIIDNIVDEALEIEKKKFIKLINDEYDISKNNLSLSEWKPLTDNEKLMIKLKKELMFEISKKIKK